MTDLRLKISGWESCPECKGRGHVPCPKTFSVRSTNWRNGLPNRQPGEGKPVPCPRCLGKKVVSV